NQATRALSAFQAQVDGGAIFNKDGWVTPYISNLFARVVTPANAPINQRLSSIRDSSKLGLDFRPGVRALEFRAQYGFDIVKFDDNQGNQSPVLDPAALSFIQHDVQVRGMWRFFPKTGLFVEAQGTFTRYPW